MNITPICEIEGFAIKDVKEELDSIWNELKTQQSGTYQDAIDANIDKNELNVILEEDYSNVFVVEAKKSGLDPIIGGIIIAIAKAVGTKIAIDIWTHIFLPRLKKRFGSKSIKESSSAENHPQDQ